MLPEKYSHLKLELLSEEYQYVLCDGASQFQATISSLAQKDIDFCSFAFKGEFSLICPSSVEVTARKVQPGWAAMKVVGEMPFGTVQGLINMVSASLFKEKLGVCIVSTFETDLFLVRSTNVEAARAALTSDGWTFI